MGNSCFGDVCYWKRNKPSQRGFPSGAAVKNLPANAGDMGDAGSISGLGRSLGRGNYKPLQYTCLGNPMDRGARWAIVHEAAKESDMTATNNTLKCLGKSGIVIVLRLLNLLY